jgi:hypothetical protein
MKTYKVTVDDYGTKCWYNQQDRLHREDGPAIEGANGTKFWYLNGKCHREDGPAYEGADGFKWWFLNGIYLTEAEFNARTKKQPSCDGKIVEIDGKKYKLQQL